VLGQYLLTQLDVLVLGLLLCGTGVNNLLPLVVLGLALIELSVCDATWPFGVAQCVRSGMWAVRYDGGYGGEG
jgi:hypothetical protein